MMGARPEAVSYHNVIVQKPWGYEYLMFENGVVALWYLFIKPGARTSLHCHPRKKTGLILLAGEAEVSFLNGSQIIRPLSKVMMREGLFHSTAANSSEGIVVLETETPCDKEDLVRLEDTYGRQEQPYESSGAVIPFTEQCLQFQEPEKGQQRQYTLCGCTLRVERPVDHSVLFDRPPGQIIVVLSGGLMSRTEDVVLGPGDVVSSETVHRLAKTFSAPHGISLLTIQKTGQGSVDAPRESPKASGGLMDERSR